MKRRGFVQALISVPAAGTLVAQQTTPAQPAPGIPQNPSQPIQPPGSAAMELPKLTATIPDAAASMMPRYFSPSEFATLQKLSEVIMPGAAEAKAAEFLDFLIGESPFDRQQVYRTGLAQLNALAQKSFNETFASLNASQADGVLAALREPWVSDTPVNPLERFLRVAKQDIRTATVNSREYAASSRAGGRRGGGGLYWYPLD